MREDGKLGGLGRETTDACTPAGWHGPVAEFLALTEGPFLDALSAHLHRCMGLGPDGLQTTAWRNEFAVLQTVLGGVASREPRARHWHLVFEYELPRERGRRPDVVVLTGSQVIVLEFKDADHPQAAHIDQVAAYARDLSEYHAASHDKLVDPVLVLTRSHEPGAGQRGSQGEPSAVPDPREHVPSPYEVTITGPAALAEVLLTLESRSPAEPLDAETWLQADYAPLPSLVNAARMIFDHEPLPFIRRCHSAGVYETVANLQRAAAEACANHELHLALVTGVPGSGKTLVGLQFVYESHFGESAGERSAVFLSGNGPLVDVLQYALKSRVFVQDVHGFLKQYGGTGGRVPEEHIWVYDEAQRAWDAERVLLKRRHACSEPEDFLRIGGRKDWALMVGLIGEGQEIYLGEEAGLGQWNDALARTPQRWVVHCPPKIAHLFPDAARLEVEEELDLTVSLRTHLAEDVQLWVEQLLAGKLEVAEETAERVRQQRYDIYATDDLNVAKEYARERYRTAENARYGVLASSKAKLERFGVDASFQATRRLRVGPWFWDPPTAPRSCCQLEEVATEFQCQGLELDLPVVAWGTDVWWEGRLWKSRPEPRSEAHDPHRLRLNSYRVLLTRGRDGAVVFVPRGLPAFDGTFGALRKAGAELLG